MTPRELYAQARAALRAARDHTRESEVAEYGAALAGETGFDFAVDWSLSAREMAIDAARAWRERARAARRA